MRKIIKVIIYIFVYLVALELLLQISGFIYVKTKYKVQNQKSPKSDSLRIMFIGDSWTQGAEAAPMPAYVPLTIEKLNQLYPERHIEGYNYAYGSTNSSQAIHHFLDYYKQIRPQILVVMTGANNGWNTQDVLSARKRIRNEISNYKDNYKIRFSEYTVNNIKKFKIAKLYNLILYNLIYKPREIKIPLADTKYSSKYFQTYNEYKGPEKARDHLIDNYKEAKDYNEFYKLMLHSFGGDVEKAQNYLKNKNMWKPKFIRGNLSIKETKRYRNLAIEILEENLTDLKLLCDQEDIIMVVENYPHMSSGFIDFNRNLDEIVHKIGVIYVDNYRYFEENIGYKKWEEVVTLAHVNAEGHIYMADNLVNYLVDILNRL